jgi:hypothetical protein
MTFTIQQGRLGCNSCMYLVFCHFDGGCSEIKHGETIEL